MNVLFILALTGWTLIEGEPRKWGVVYSPPSEYNFSVVHHSEESCVRTVRDLIKHDQRWQYMLSQANSDTYELKLECLPLKDVGPPPDRFVETI